MDVKGNCIMILGLVEIQQHDEHGNLLNISRGHNIIFDNARVAMLLNPSIVDTVTDFTMYFSEFKETVLSYYSYWSSSLLTNYLTSTITMASEDHSLFTKMYTFTSLSLLPPGGIARTLRVVGLRNTSLSRYCTAITLNTPIAHGSSTYITGYYKLIFGYGEESTLYDNIYNWMARTWYTVGSYIYRKGFYANNFGVNVITSETVASLTVRTQSAYNTIAVNTALTTARLFGAKEKDGNTSVALLNNLLSDGNYQATKSRVFLHAAGATDFYGNLLAAIPISEGTIRPTNIEDFEYPMAVCINITKSGPIGIAEYTVTLYPLPLIINSKYTEKLVNYFYADYKGLTTAYSYYNVYFSENRKWSFVNDGAAGVMSVWYKGLVSIPYGSLAAQGNGVITNNGVAFHAKTGSLTTLRRYDFERMYEEGYVEETTVLPITIRGYHIDESSNKLVALCYTSVSTLVVNGTFPANVNNWTAETYISLSWESGYGGHLHVSISYYAGVHTYGFYQDITTVVGKKYYVSITDVGTYNGPWKLNLDTTTVITCPGVGTPTIYTAYYTATSTTTRLKVIPTLVGGYSLYFDNISLICLDDTNGTIVKVDTNNMAQDVYNITHPNFSSLISDSLIFTVATDRWYWRANQGKVVWLGSYSCAKKFHYWDGTNVVETYDVATTGTVLDVCVTEDFKKLCYVVQNVASCTWFVRSLEDGSRWNQLYSVTRTIPASGGYDSNITAAGCFVDDTWMYQLSAAASWGYRTNLLTYVAELWPIFAGDTAYLNNQTLNRLNYLPNRSMIPGVLMYNFYSGGYYTVDGSNHTFSKYFLDLYPFNFGWDGSEWIKDYVGSKVTHDGDENLPLYGSIGFGDQISGTIENYVLGEYLSFSVNPSGYVFDNSMTYTATPWVYTGVPQYFEETLYLAVADPLNPTNIEVILTKTLHPDFLCIEVSSDFTTVEFPDDGIMGTYVSAGVAYLSYFGEYYIDPTSGIITFHKDCDGHTAIVKYYWIRRDV